MFTCPVCFYNQLEEPAADYNICDCCGTEFGNDDEQFTHTELRNRWIAAGARWFYHDPPSGWNPWRQLYRNYVTEVPFSIKTVFAGSSVHVATARHSPTGNEQQYAAVGLSLCAAK